MITFEFHGRKASPNTAQIGAEGDLNAESLRFLLPQVSDDQTAQLMMLLPDSTPEMVLIREGMAQVSDIMCEQPGRIRAWVEILGGDGAIVWNSSEFYLDVEDLPPIDQEVQHEYPTAIRDAMIAVEQTLRYKEAAEAAAQEAADNAAQAISDLTDDLTQLGTDVGNMETRVQEATELVEQAYNQSQEAADAVPALIEAAEQYAQYDSRLQQIETDFAGKVNKSGDTMTGNLRVQKANAGLELALTSDQSRFAARFILDDNGRPVIQQRAEGSAEKEVYSLPAPEVTNTQKQYNLLTDKAPVSVAQGGTGADTAAAARQSLGIPSLIKNNLTTTAEGYMLDARQGKALDDKITALLGRLMAGNAGAHNAIYRGKSLGGSVTDAQWAAIGAGTFGDLFIGDYWTIGGVNWRIAAFDYWINTQPVQAHHVVIVPDSMLAYDKMNNAASTSGGYRGSDFRTGGNSNSARASAIGAVERAFEGQSHILTYKDFLSSSVDANGQVIAVEYEDCTVELMNEIMVYGCHAVGEKTVKNLQDYTVSMTQLPLFRLDRERIAEAANNQWYLRDITSETRNACVHQFGAASSVVQHSERGIRPVFAIRQAT